MTIKTRPGIVERPRVRRSPQPTQLELPFPGGLRISYWRAPEVAETERTGREKPEKSIKDRAGECGC
jgi:hypothetical protein